jgi:hypothetical protein
MSARAADVSLPRARPRSRVIGWISQHRALTAAAVVWILFAANFNLFSLAYTTDPERVFGFLQHLLGERGGTPDAYQFGLAFGWMPFYGLGKLVVLGGVHSIGGKPSLEGIVALSASFFVLAAAAVMVPVLDALRIRRTTFVLVCAVFGTPLFFYGTFNPGHTHAFETFLLTVVVALLLLYFRKEEGSPALALAMGVILALAATVRYFLGVEIVVLVLGLAWYRRWRDSAIVASSTLIGLGLPALGAYLTAGDVLRGAGTVGEPGLHRALGVLDFAPLNPERMLFSDHRGLFIWSPVTILAVFGFARLFRRRQHERPFFAICAAMAVAMLLSFVFSPYWDGGFGAFNQRYLTALFPLVAIGLGGALEWRPGLVRAAAVLAVAWTLFLGLYRGSALWYANNGASEAPSSLIHGKVTPNLVAYNLYRVSNFSFLVPYPFAHR